MGFPVLWDPPVVDEVEDLTPLNGVGRGRMSMYKKHRRAGKTNAEWLRTETTRVTKEAEKKLSDEYAIKNFENVSTALALSRQETVKEHADAEGAKAASAKSSEIIEALMKWAVQEKNIPSEEVMVVIRSVIGQCDA